MRKILVSVILFTIPFFVFGQEFEPKINLPLEEIVSEEILVQLKEKGSVKRDFYGKKNIELTLAPQTVLGQKAANYWQRKKNPVFIVESLYLLDKKNKNEQDTIQKISKILTNLSEMTDMQYYSSSREMWETLYTDVYTVNNPVEKIRIEDPNTEDVTGLKSYVYQKDRSLSGTVYDFSYFTNLNEVTFRAMNTEKIHYHVMNISIVEPENLVITLNASDVGDSILFYLLVQADVPKIPFVSQKLARSFASRADAIYNWCIEMYQATEE